MLGAIAPTDYGWYEFLSEHPQPEVNFWTPSGRRAFTAPEFCPFFFKLKKPHHAICGFGYFARWSRLPDWLAWDTFGLGNGCENLRSMRERIGVIREGMRYVPAGGLNEIGCILLVQPTFFKRDEWIPQPADWPVHLQVPRKYDLTAGEGQRIWEACLERSIRSTMARTAPMFTDQETARYGTPRLIVPRLGQGTFRVAVTEAYGRACAVTGEHSLPAIEAAHIRPYSCDGPHDIRNGILLRADLHRLFDQGYVTVTPAHRFEVSSRLRADFSNGHCYYPLHGRRISTPPSSSEKPANEFLDWHNSEVYLG